jgi:hypothetical protein
MIKFCQDYFTSQVLDAGRRCEMFGVYNKTENFSEEYHYVEWGCYTGRRNATEIRRFGE